jgi:hypothetical protein
MNYQSTDWSVSDNEFPESPQSVLLDEMPALHENFFVRTQECIAHLWIARLELPSEQDQFEH